MSKYTQIVIARYNETLTWLLEFPFNQFTYIVYNKGENQDFEKKNVSKIIDLPNVGRCDHTYLYHIVTNYNNLAPITVFFPGSINSMIDKKDKAIKILKNILTYNMAVFLGTYLPNVKQTFNNFVLEFIYLFIYVFIYLLFVFVHMFIYSFIYVFVYVFIYSFID